MVVLRGDRAQSESIGVLLLVAVVVIAMTTFGAYYLASTTGDTGTGGDNVDVAIDAEATTDTVELAHNGGDSVPITALRVVVENESGEYTYAFSDGEILDGGGADGQFDAGETWALSWNQSAGAEVTVSLIDDDSQTLLFRETLSISATATNRPGYLIVVERSRSSTTDVPSIDKPI